MRDKQDLKKSRNKRRKLKSSKRWQKPEKSNSKRKSASLLNKRNRSETSSLELFSNKRKSESENNRRKRKRSRSSRSTLTSFEAKSSKMKRSRNKTDLTTWRREGSWDKSLTQRRENLSKLSSKSWLIWMILELHPNIRLNLPERKLLKFNSFDDYSSHPCVTHEGWSFSLNFGFVYFHIRHNYFWCPSLAVFLENCLPVMLVM